MKNLSLETRIPETKSPSHPALIDSERIYLRGVTLEDVTDAYFHWMNDPEVIQYLESRFYPQSRDGIRAFVQSFQGNQNNVFFAIILKEDNRHIGNIKLGAINWIHRLAEIGLIIGEKDTWGKGFATEAIRLVSDYAFKCLNLHKVSAGCYGINQGSVRAFQRAGFEVEGVRPKHMFCEGNYVDLVLLGKLNPQSLQ